MLHHLCEITAKKCLVKAKIKLKVFLFIIIKLTVLSFDFQLLVINRPCYKSGLLNRFLDSLTIEAMQRKGLRGRELIFRYWLCRWGLSLQTALKPLCFVTARQVTLFLELSLLYYHKFIQSIIGISLNSEFFLSDFSLKPGNEHWYLFSIFFILISKIL